MISSRFYHTLIFIFFITLAIFFPHQTLAISLSPPAYTVSLDPGTSSPLTFNIKNDETKTQRLRISIVGARQNKQGTPFFESGQDDGHVSSIANDGL